MAAPTKNTLSAANQESPEGAAALDRLHEAASAAQFNLMPPILEAVRAYASIGEICGVLRETFGEYRERYGS